MNSTIVRVLRRRDVYDLITAKLSRAISCSSSCSAPLETVSYHSLPRTERPNQEGKASVPRLISRHIASPSQSQTLIENEKHENGIQISKSATSRLENLRDESQGKRIFLRLSVEGGGCSGFSYEFNIEENPPAQDDLIFEAAPGAAVICDTISYEFLRGATVDFESNLMRSAFVVRSDNPSDHAFSTFSECVSDEIFTVCWFSTGAGSGQS